MTASLGRLYRRQWTEAAFLCNTSAKPASVTCEIIKSDVKLNRPTLTHVSCFVDSVSNTASSVPKVVVFF